MTVCGDFPKWMPAGPSMTLGPGAVFPRDKVLGRHPAWRDWLGASGPAWVGELL